MKLSHLMSGKTKIAAAAVAVGAMIFSMGGCSNPTAATSAESDTSAVSWPKATKNLKGVTLTFWSSPQANKIPTKVISDFERDTGAKIELTTIPEEYENNARTKITTGDMPDVAFWQPTASMLAGFVASDQLQKLDNAPFIKNYKEGIADAGGTYKGHRYSVMVSAPSTIGVYYNKDVFKKAGVSIPKGWDEFVKVAKKIKAANVEGVASPLFEMGGSQWGTQWAVQAQLAEAVKDGFWDRVNSGKEKFTDETMMTAIKNYKALFDEGLYNKDAGSAKDTAQEAALLAGKTGMIFGNASQFQAIAALAKNDKSKLDSTIGYFSLSQKGNLTTLIPDGSSGVVAFKTGDEVKEAASRQFINYWMSDGYSDFINDQNIVSALKTVDSPDTVPQAMVDEEASIANSVGSMQSLAIANPDFFVNLANMVNGTMTPQQVAKTTQDQFAEVAKAQGASGF